MSNPYDPNGSNNPYGGSESSGGGYGAPQGGGYGAPQGGGYGTPQGGGDGGYGNPYGQNNPYGSEPPKKTDAVSIIGFILSLTCCLSIVGAIMGFVGLSRTKGGKRKGRWAAIAAAIIGILGTIAAGAIGAIAFVFVDSLVTVDEAEAGTCINVDDSDKDGVIFYEKDCTDKHDGEFVYKGTADDIDPNFVPSDIDDITDSAIAQAICESKLDAAYVAAIGDDVEWSFASKDGNPTGTETYVCYVTSTEGKLDKQLKP